MAVEKVVREPGVSGRMSPALRILSWGTLEEDLLSAQLLAFPLKGGVDMVMFPLSQKLAVTVCPGNSDSVHDVDVVVITTSSSVQVVSAVPLLGVVGWPVTLTSVPGAPPPSVPGKDEYSSSQVEVFCPTPPAGAVPVPVSAGMDELVNHGELCEGGIPVAVPPDQGPVIVSGLPVVEALEDKDGKGPGPVEVPEEVSTALLTPVAQEPVDAGCVEFGHGPVLPCPDDVADMGLVKTVPSLVPTDQSAVSVDEPEGSPVPGAVKVWAWLASFPDEGAEELGIPPEGVAEPPCGPVGKENDVPSEDKAVAGFSDVAVPLPVANENDVSPALDGTPVPPGGSVEFPMGKENDAPLEESAVSGPPEVAVPLPVGNENDVSPELDGTAVPPGGSVEFPVGNEKEISESDGTPVPPWGIVWLPVGNEKDVAPEPEGGTPVPECGIVAFLVGKENDADPEPDGAPVAPVRTVESVVGKENDVSPGPDGKFVSPECVGFGTVQIVELPLGGGTPPELAAVPVPVCSTDVPVPEPETRLVVVMLPVGSPETPVCVRVRDELPLPEPPDAEPVGKPVDS